MRNTTARVGPPGIRDGYPDFDFGMIYYNAATYGATALVDPKLVINVAIQSVINGKDADMGDAVINRYSPLSYWNLVFNGALDVKPVSDDPTPSIVFINKDPRKAAADVGFNFFFFGLGKFPITTKPLSKSQKLFVSTVNGINKGVVKKVFSDGMFPKQPANASESTKPPIYTPSLKQR